MSELNLKKLFVLVPSTLTSVTLKAVKTKSQETANSDKLYFVEKYNQIVKNLFGEPAVLKIFSEFGVTIKTVCFAIETFSQIHPYSYGMNYIKGSLAFLPNIGGFITNSIKELVYVYY